MLDLVEAEREPLSYGELIQMDVEPAFDEEMEPAISKQLTLKNVSTVFSYFEQGKNDSDVERSAKVSRGINSAIRCYKSLKNEMD